MGPCLQCLSTLTPASFAKNGCPFKLPGTCIYYTGPNIGPTFINNGDTFDTVVNKLYQYINIANPGGTLTSVNVAADGNATQFVNGPITTSGTIQLQFNGDSTQFIGGDGNLYPIGAGSVTSVGLIVPPGMNSTTGPITSSGNLTITMTGTPNQYLGGDGFLHDFPPPNADNGIRYNGAVIELGQPSDTPPVGDPAKLIFNTEIPLNEFNLTFRGSSGTEIFGVDRGLVLLQETAGEFVGWPYTSNFTNSRLGVQGAQPYIDILVDPTSTFGIGGISWRSTNPNFPYIDPTRVGAHCYAAMEANAFTTGGTWVSTIEFYLGTAAGNVVLTPLTIAKDGDHFFGTRVHTTVDAHYALFCGTKITGAPNFAFSSVTATFAMDANNIPPVFFNMPAKSPLESTDRVLIWESTDGDVLVSTFADLAAMIPGIPITANNGLNMSTTTNVQLGGTLLQHTTIDGGATFQLISTSSVSGTIPTFSGINTGTGAGLLGIAVSGTAVGGNATSGVGLSGLVTSGTALNLRATTGIASIMQILPATTNSVDVISQYQRATSGTAANGIGMRFDLAVQTSTGSIQVTNQIVSKWTDAANATRTSQFEIWGSNNAVVSQLFTIKGNGTLNTVVYQDFADNAAAITGGLVNGDHYRTGDIVKQVHP